MLKTYIIKDSLIYNVLKIIFPCNEVLKPVKLGCCLISEGILFHRTNPLYCRLPYGYTGGYGILNRNDSFVMCHRANSANGFVPRDTRMTSLQLLLLDKWPPHATHN